MSNKEQKLQEELDTLKSAVVSFIEKVNENTTSLWKADISEAEDCVVLFPCSLHSDPDDENTIEEFDGIQDKIIKLEKLVK